MKRKYTYIYDMFPVWFQNILISLYGYKINIIRHKGNYSKYYVESVKKLTDSKKQIDDFQNSTLKSLLENAVSNVEYYKSKNSQGEFDYKRVETLKDLKYLPLLDKEHVRKNPELFVSRHYSKDQLITVNTTGTTGKPLNIFCNSNVRRKNYAFYDRFLTNIGIDVQGKRATLGGRIIMSASRKKAPFWRYSFFQKNMLFSSYHLSDENMEIYIDKLRQYNPEFIDSYPSSIFSIAEYAIRNNIDLSGITKVITTSGETLFIEQKEIIEDAFGVKVYDQYGAAEMCVFIGQCSEGRYHIYSDFGVVEILNDKGEPSLPGEEGEVVCTGFVNDVMPLIRYRIGDRAVATDDVCNCLSPFPLVERILGREDDVIITPEGNKVGRLSPVMKGFPVIESQYVQYTADSIELSLIKAAGYMSETETEIIKELRKRLGSKINIIIKHVTELPRGKGGKLKSIISHIKRRHID